MQFSSISTILTLVFVAVALPVAHSSEESSAVAVRAAEDEHNDASEGDDSLRTLLEFGTIHST